MRLLFAVLVLSAACASAARAAPPTAQPSPGYDRALAESRRTEAQAPMAAQPSPVLPHRHKPRRSPVKPR
jgi:hypothetical protein